MPSKYGIEYSQLVHILIVLKQVAQTVWPL